MRNASEIESVITSPLPVHSRHRYPAFPGEHVVLHPRTSTADTKLSHASTTRTEHSHASGGSSSKLSHARTSKTASTSRPRTSSTSVPLQRPYSCISTPPTTHSPSPYSSRSNTPDKDKTPTYKLSENTPACTPSSSSKAPPPPPLRTPSDIHTHLSQNHIATPVDPSTLAHLPPYRYALRIEILKARQKRRDSLWTPYGDAATTTTPPPGTPESYGNKYLAALQQRNAPEEGMAGRRGGLVWNESVGVWRPWVGRSCFSRVMVLFGVLCVVVVVLAVVVTQVVEKRGGG
ncbi:hypothetical protein GTA08_BOTSDO12421 [Botryosphaeria dothidea]|uniref:Uncharacterized protein n=1 Tax=Botryosphaeria dothidea TaxID=55169 RepID=A0A8H4N9C6_9PEZI|nr:hypothetical protein GTA08_BOTSDO02717 [Botryosphaeria dothidea]KAF4312103.1 hypothetical protein GTA08_BOTSDO12421 [Botryosphaeria dothidea]